MRLLEPPLIQQRGFRNVIENGQVIGFQVAIRLNYYRGVWVSQLREATVTVDEETFTGNQLYWTINEHRIEQPDLPKSGDIHWNSTEVAILTILKKGGLQPGLHHLKIAYNFNSSYLPEAIEIGFFDTKGERKMVLVG